MLTKFDELFCHQTVSTFDHVVDSGRNWAEKTYFSAFDISGKIVIGAGLGRYPNRNVMDAYGGVAVEGTRQYAVRASRELRPDVDVTRVGPRSYEVVEPLSKIRHVLAENEFGVSFDIEFEGLTPPFEEPGGFTRRYGAVMNNTCRFFQMGRVSGEVTVEGKTHRIKKETWYAQRDRSWGINPNVGVPAPGSWWYREHVGVQESGLQPSPPMPGMLAVFCTMQFDDHCAFYTHYEDPEGKPIRSGMSGQGGMLLRPYGDSRPPVPITDARFDFEFHSGTDRVKSGQVVFRAEDGTHREISIRPLGTVFYAAQGGYLAGFRGWVHGKWQGPYAIAGERLDLTDETVLKELRGQDEVACEYRCGDEVGYGVLNCNPVGTLPRFGLEG